MDEIDIYIYVDGSDLDDIAGPITEELDAWVNKNGFEINVVNHRHEKTSELKPNELPYWDLGVNLKPDNSLQFEKALQFLNDIAHKYKRDFALGYYSESSGISEDIDYFGYESGNPNIVEIKQSLSIE